jgi:cell wall-associated NlpC family hydrolase
LIQRSHIQHRARAGVAALAAGTLLGSAVLAPSALAGGGVSAGPTHHHRTVAGAKAKLHGQVAYAPKSAPKRVKAAIAAANKIARGHAYMLGGGHEYKNGHPIWNPKALARYQGVRKSKYDCSGTVSYVLHAANAISAPMPSGPMEKWGTRGKGKWISVYANGGHAWMTIAGLRFDTSDTPGDGPGWAKTMGYENPSSFKVRHKAGL